MCLACEQDAIWLAYLDSRGLLKPDDPAALEEFFGAFPVRELPVSSPTQDEPESATGSAAKANAPAVNPFSCDDPTTE